jgi:HAMP domain-containing protein
MKTIGLFLLLVVLLVAAFATRGPSENAVDIAQAQSVMEAAHAAQDAANAAQVAAQGISDVGRGQTLILLLLTVVVVVLLGLALYLVIRRLIRIQSTFHQPTTGRWISEPNAHWRKTEEPDLYQQMLIEQQLLLTQLLSQGHEDDAEAHDLLDLPHDWWS